MNNPFWFWDQFIRGRKPSEETRHYQKLLWRSLVAYPGGQDANRVKSFDVEGDTLTIWRVSGGMPVYVRLGDDSNPFIRVDSQAVLRRPFRRVTFAVGNTQFGPALYDNAESSVLAYASFGPLVDHFPPRRYGLRRMPIMRTNIQVNNLGAPISAVLSPAGIPIVPTAGLFGGRLMIKNLAADGLTSLYLLPGGTGLPAPTFGNHGWQVAAGETVTFDLDDCLAYLRGSLDQANDLWLKSAGVIIAVQLCLSSAEIDDIDGTIGWDHSPSLP